MPTLEEVRASSMRETAHYNGGKDWFGYGHQGIEYPRLYRIDRYMRKDRSVEKEWQVDGEKCASFEEAVRQLNSPPAVTSEEARMLALLGRDFIKRSALKEKPEYLGFEDPFHVLHFLARKGLIEWEAGAVRLTASGIEARSDETAQQAQPERQEPGPQGDAQPNPETSA